MTLPAHSSNATVANGRRLDKRNEREMRLSAAPAAGVCACHVRRHVPRAGFFAVHRVAGRWFEIAMG